MRPVLFLDVDGVLNAGEFNEGAQSNTLRRDCVERLNRVLDATDAQIVLSSSWRYMVLNGAMTLSGFSYLLRTHGVHASGYRLLGVTPADGTQAEDPRQRFLQIQTWLDENPAPPGTRCWAVVDDTALPFDETVFVRTDGDQGLRDEDADRLIQILNGRAA